MAKKPDTPCAGGCGKLLWSGGTSLPAGQRKCRDCRRITRTTGIEQRCGRCGEFLVLAMYSPANQRKLGSYCRPCQATYARERAAVRRTPGDDLCDECSTPTSRGRTAYGIFCEPCAAARKRARESRKVSLRRTVQRFSDITAAYERDLRTTATHCPLCSAALTDAPGRPTSKQLDHIVPICLGGTHTMGNVRIICRTCNLTRPKDGSDVTDEQLERWAQDARLVDEIKARIKERTTGKVCRCGRPLVKQSCRDCPARLEERRQRAGLGREAARMRAAGLKWREISDALRLSGPGTAYAMAWQHGDPEAKSNWPRDQRWAAPDAA